MVVRKPAQTFLTRDDWAEAALDAIARGGIDAIAVEPIAAELGATKGSFYWHFKNRDALVEAALELWERRGTDEVIQRLELEPDPARRLRMVMEGGVERTDRAESFLLANPSHPVALRAVRRVAKRRITYMAKQLEALGRGPQDAFDRALLIYYVYVGYIQLSQVAPRLVASEARRRQVDVAFDTLVRGDPD